jgi:hypothetical protein
MRSVCITIVMREDLIDRTWGEANEREISIFLSPDVTPIIAVWNIIFYVLC